MKIKNENLFDDNLHYSSEPDYKVYELRLSNLISKAASLGFTALLIDQYKKSVKLIHYNPKIKCLGNLGVFDIDESFTSELTNDSFHIPVDTYFSVSKFYLRSIKKTECVQISFNTKLTMDDKSENVELKFVPYFFHTVNKKTLWLTLCLILPTEKPEPGNFIYSNIDTKINKFIVFEDMLEYDQAVSHLISQAEFDIINDTADGLNEAEIIEKKKISLSTLKYIKNSLITKLNAKTIIQVIAILRKQGF